MNAITKLAVLNRYYRITRFYAFLKQLTFKMGIALAGFIALYFVVDLFILDLQALFDLIVRNYSSFFIFSVFFTSEIIFGLLPPEIFIAWGLNSLNPWLSMFFLATLSYVAGIIAYWIGRWMYTIPAVRSYLVNKIPRHIVNLRKWGGLFVFVGAMLPMPHSVVSLSSGLIRYNFKSYVLWALFRYLRFLVFALAMFKIV